LVRTGLHDDGPVVGVGASLPVSNPRATIRQDSAGDAQEPAAGGGAVPRGGPPPGPGATGTHSCPVAV